MVLFFRQQALTKMVFVKDKPGKLYVSGLPSSLDEKGLGLAFAKFGPISDGK